LKGIVTRWNGYTILEEDEDKMGNADLWNAVVVAMGGIAGLYVPVSDLNVLSELAERKTSSVPLSRQGFGMDDDAISLDDL
jgi:hypothetical protein